MTWRDLEKECYVGTCSVSRHNGTRWYILFLMVDVYYLVDHKWSRLLLRALGWCRRRRRSLVIIIVRRVLVAYRALRIYWSGWLVVYRTLRGPKVGVWVIEHCEDQRSGIGFSVVKDSSLSYSATEDILCITKMKRGMSITSVYTKVEHFCLLVDQYNWSFVYDRSQGCFHQPMIGS